MVESALIFLFDRFFEARADIQKYFRLFFGSNENFKICFKDFQLRSAEAGGYQRKGG